MNELDVKSYYYYDLHGKLSVKSSKPLFEEFPRVDPCETDLTINVMKEIEWNLENSEQLGQGFYGAEGEKWVYFEKKLFGKKIKLLLKDLEGRTGFWVNENFINIVKMPFPTKDVYTLWHYINAILSVKLLQKNSTLIHAGCLTYDNSGILLPAYPNTGKTTTTLTLSSKEGAGGSSSPTFKCLSDDLCIVDLSGTAYSVHPTITTSYIAERCNTGLSLRFGRLRKLLSPLLWNLSKIPFFPNFSYIDYVNIHQFLENKNKLALSAIIKYIFILEKGEEKVKRLNCEEASRKIYAINRREFYYSPSPLIWTYYYFNKSLNLPNLQDLENQIIMNMVHTAECFVLRCPDSFRYPQIIEDMLSRQETMPNE